ncbi:MAG: SDR family oxidoreductase [Leptolyngbyaceae cyanobacterium SM1_1_3]|nr:SDR family oxidoreductase [Leptolyngbyaceae cyanobacterium SM1_1_3]NJN02280.1 SDR family oxidoreductase [Leptolyngbyaceae cyanobacterium RM1_1_2]NJO08439.1 SDR family oxidoreductase [Leptolyngbyaceae cyanobacterium SL_1_1]
MHSSETRRALITGASSGIGKATALAFAQHGFDLALVSRSESKLAAVAAQAEASGVMSRPYAIDLAQLDQVKPQLETLLADFGPIDVLVNNAGMGYTCSLADTPLSDWQQVIDLNLTSVFQCVQAVLPGMRDRQQGLIINVASIAADQTFPEWGAYSVSKAGVLALARVLATEECQHGIRVATICPGAVNTEIWDTETVNADFDRSAMLTPEAVADTILQMALLPRSAIIDKLTLMPSGGTL